MKKCVLLTGRVARTLPRSNKRLLNVRDNFLVNVFQEVGALLYT